MEPKRQVAEISKGGKRKAEDENHRQAHPHTQPTAIVQAAKRQRKTPSLLEADTQLAVIHQKQPNLSKGSNSVSINHALVDQRREDLR